MDAPISPKKERSNFLEKLNIDEEEIDRCKRFLQFHQDDADRLKSISGIAERYADEVIEGFYRHLLSFEETHVFFNA